MPLARATELLPLLQTSIGPVILISGVGLLLLSMTNRYGRVIDRSRDLVRRMADAAERERARLLAEIEVLYRRALLVRASIELATLSLLMAALLMVTMFVGALAGWDDGALIIALFVLAMLALIASLLLFLKDLGVSLAALRLEVEHAREVARGE